MRSPRWRYSWPSTSAPRRNSCSWRFACARPMWRRSWKRWGWKAELTGEKRGQGDPRRTGGPAPPFKGGEGRGGGRGGAAIREPGGGEVGAQGGEAGPGGPARNRGSALPFNVGMMARGCDRARGTARYAGTAAGAEAEGVPTAIRHSEE